MFRVLERIRSPKELVNVCGLIASIIGKAPIELTRPVYTNADRHYYEIIYTRSVYIYICSLVVYRFGPRPVLHELAHTRERLDSGQV